MADDEKIEVSKSFLEKLMALAETNTKNNKILAQGLSDLNERVKKIEKNSFL